MSPIMEPDFDWTDVSAATPIYEKGTYELSSVNIKARAWRKTDENGNPTGEIVRVIDITPEMQGVVDSNGKLNTKQEGKEIKGQPAERLPLWIHSEGGRRQGKQRMMAICGYNPFEHEDEKKFDAFLKSSKLDLSVKLEEGDEGQISITIGDGYEKLLVGKRFRAVMSPEKREIEGRDPIISQNYERVIPVNSD